MWRDLVFKLKDEEEIDHECKLYDSAAQTGDDGGFLNVLCDAELTVSLLNNRVDVFRNPPPPIATSFTNGSLNPASTMANKSMIKLPPVPLPKFSGDPLDWHHFWSVFDANVGQAKITDVQKYNYLHQQVEGTARRAISRMQVTDSSYSEPVKILKERFERDPVQLELALLSELKRLPTATRSVDIRITHDTCERILRQLDTMGADIDTNQSLSLELYSKYPKDVVKKIMQRFDVPFGAAPRKIHEAIAQYLREQELLTELYTDVKPFSHPITEPSSKSRRDNNAESQHFFSPGGGGRRESAPSTSALVATEKSSTKPSVTTKGILKSSPPPCHFCTGAHFNTDCNKYRTVTARIQRLKELGRCTGCFSTNHNAAECKTPARFFRCYYCNEKTVHKSALCPIKFADEKSVSKTAATVAGEKKSAKVIGSCAMGANENAVLLTAVTTITNPKNGAQKRIRVMLDTGSHRSFVKEKVASELRCDFVHDESLQIAVFGSKRTWDVKTGRVELQMDLRSSKEPMDLTLNVIPLITECYFGPGKLPKTIQHRIHAMDYAMADDFNPELGPPDVLIGSEYFWQFIRGEPMEIGKTLFLVPTTLGFILSGSYKTDEKQHQATLVCLTERTTERCITASLSTISAPSRCQQPEPDMDEFWSLEKIGICDNPMNNEDEMALDQFNRTIRFRKNRYQVCWPWNDQRDRLRTNYKLVTGRLQSLAKRLSSSPPSLIEEYERVINYQADVGIIERVTDEEAHNPKHATHYLPHHPVVRVDHETTKLRIVYDASAKCGKDSVSLNECMYRGPIILPDLCSILLRFRLNEVAIIADIEKAFLQIELQPSERDVTRFLWFRSTKRFDANNHVTYRFTRVPFGIISSPFLLGATIRHHLNKVDGKTAKQINENIYVDNMITGSTDVKTAISTYQEGKRIFSEASMNLREWCSNSEELMENIAEEDRSTKRTVKVLGINWDSKKDQLRLPCDWEVRRQCQTKRDILRAIASIYDPLGLFQPCTLIAKCFLRKLWLNKLSWDDKISGDLQEEWKQIHLSILPIFKISLPRYIGNGPPHQNPDATTLVVFSDASREAYATAVYLRTSTMDSTKYTTNLIYAKSRLSPKSADTSVEISIPKLELLGIVIATTAAKICKRFAKHANSC